jgi:glycosyltransferase involved in cell wall biosynthesis
MKNHKLGYFSSYDRGLDILLDMWPKIIAKFPDTTLDICYGWDLFKKGYQDNPERLAWMKKIDNQMKQKRIYHHGRVGQEELNKIQKQCGIWVYPTYFPEINCITAIQTQANGLVPITINDFALKETVHSGFKVDGDIYDKETQEEWLKCLFRVMSNEKLWKAESKKAQTLSKMFSWEEISNQWEQNFI